MGEARRKRDADWSGVARPRDEHCPACRSTSIVYMKPDEHPTMAAAWLEASNYPQPELGLCKACAAVWEAFPPLYARDPVCSEPCDNCAFRPGSPEQQDPVKWKALMEQLKIELVDGRLRMNGEFFCHKGVPIDMKAGPGNFLFPVHEESVDGKVVQKMRRGRLCSGFLAMQAVQVDKALKTKGEVGSEGDG